MKQHGPEIILLFHRPTNEILALQKLFRKKFPGTLATHIPPKSGNHRNIHTIISQLVTYMSRDMTIGNHGNTDPEPQYPW